MGESEETQSLITVPTNAPALTTTEWTAGEQRALIKRAFTGDKAAIPELRAMLDAHPEVVQAEGNLAHIAHLAMIAAVASGDIILSEVLPLRVAQMQTELEGPHPTALESLLCERIATCWLAVYLLDAARIETANGERPPEDVIMQHERMKQNAHKRYIEACLALAKVRHLLPRSRR
ncbi:MAG TPA: hypothetical protein VFW76_04030 [Ktedonobacterales bacterium]|nr:hypothetical protein [Ktedonobacterales bacterium]